jgi:hypothetical protein
MPARRKTTNLSSHTATPNWRHISAYLPLKVYKLVETKATVSRRSISAQVVVMLEEAARSR